MAKRTYTSFVNAPDRPFVVQWTNHNGWRSYHRFATLEQARAVASAIAEKGATDIAIWTGDGTDESPSVEVERFAT